MKLKAYYPRPNTGWQRPQKGWLCLLTLAKEMSLELEETDIDPNALSDRQLVQEICKKLKGGNVSFMSSSIGQRRTFRKWLKVEKWWCLAILLFQTLALSCLFLIFPYVPESISISGLRAGVIFQSISVGLIITMLLSRKVNSRLFLLVPLAIVLWGLQTTAYSGRIFRSA
jgi:hypothetical protein